jgi:hypothetical protein
MTTTLDSSREGLAAMRGTRRIAAMSPAVSRWTSGGITEPAVVPDIDLTDGNERREQNNQCCAVVPETIHV